MIKNLIIWILMLSRLSAEVVNPAYCNVTRRDIMIEEGPMKLQVEFVVAGEHFDISSKNLVVVASRVEGGSKQIYLVKAGETENLEWNGEAFLISAGTRKLVCMTVKDSWDGENPKPKDLIIITDGNLVAAIKPKMGVEIDYRKEIFKALSVFAAGMADDHFSKELANQVQLIRSRK